MLWAFLPWSIIAYYAIGNRLAALWRSKLAYETGKEGLTIGTIAVIFIFFILISLSHFQLPQYLNILFPLFAIITAAKLADLQIQGQLKTIRILERIQTWVAIVLSFLAIVLCTWAFTITHIPVAILAVILLVELGMYIAAGIIPLPQ